MTKAERGTKRLCLECDNKFYDLNKDPIICPLCETTYVPPKQTLPTPRASAKAAKKPEAKAAPASEAEETEVEEAEGLKPVVKVVADVKTPEFVSLEDADAEQGAGDETDDEAAAIAELVDDDDDIPDAEDDDKFLESDDEAGSDVSDIVPTKPGSGGEA